MPRSCGPSVSMVCSLVRSWQQWVSENENKQASEPTGWDAGEERRKLSARKTSLNQTSATVPLESHGGSGAQSGKSLCKTQQMGKTAARSAQERGPGGVCFQTQRITKEALPEGEGADRKWSRPDSVGSEVEQGQTVRTGPPGEEVHTDTAIRIKRPSTALVKKENEDANKMNTLSRKYSAVGNLMGSWQHWASQHTENQKLNPFSEDFDYEYSMSTRLRKGEEGYGRPKEGTRTAERAKRAEQHIHREIDDLCYVIRIMADPGPDGKTRVTFGELFDRYVRISDKVVGILMRARKHGKVAFEGEMLWQGQDDAVVITLLV